jgi:hypothetical protein
MAPRDRSRLAYMRFVIAFFMLLAVPAFAAIGWTNYDNARFGYRGAVPSGFSGNGESDNGDGQVFERQPTMQELRYWGSMMLEDGFEAEVSAALATAEREGWNVSYQAATPDWASFTFVMGQQRLQTRMILLCDRIITATMTLRYTAAEAADIRPMVDELESRFVPIGC